MDRLKALVRYSIQSNLLSSFFTPAFVNRPGAGDSALPFDVSARQVRRDGRAKNKKQKTYPLSCRLAQGVGGTPHAT